MQKLIQLSALALVAGTLISTSGCTSAIAQNEPDSPKYRSISVTGTGSVWVKPDVASVSLGTSKSDPKLPEAKKDCDATIAQIKAALKKSGVAESEIQTVQYQIYRVNADPKNGIKESLWKVTHRIQIRTKKPESIANIVDIGVAAGATDVSSINFSVDSLAVPRIKARQLAIGAAQEKARQLADLTHVSLGKVITVTEQNDGGYAQYQTNVSMDYRGGGEGFGSGISGGQIEVGTSTSVVFEIQ